MITKAWKKEAAACMRYLHGWVSKDDPHDDDEIEAACLYEYARESRVLRRAAALRDCWLTRKGTSKEVCTGNENAWLDTVPMILAKRYRCEPPGFPWFIQLPWGTLWRFMPEFPRKPWVSLTAKEKKPLLHLTPTTAPVPLKMTSAAMLESLGVFDEFLKMADEQRNRPMECVQPGDKPKPEPREFTMLNSADVRATKAFGESQWFHALFTLDFSLGKKELLKRFAAWLDLPENKERIAKHTSSEKGLNGRGRLKDLAALRLLRHMSYREMIEFTKGNRLKFDGKPLEFYDVRAQSIFGGGFNSKEPMPLYRDKITAERAKERAQVYLAELIPCHRRCPGIHWDK